MHFRFCIFVLLFAACGEKSGGAGDVDSGSGADGDADSDTDSDVDADGDTDSDGDSDTDSDADTDADTDGDADNECDIVLQDCPEGEKCGGVQTNAFERWIGTACVPENADGGMEVGGICFNGADGSDTCGPDSMCVQFGTGEGDCHAHCSSASAEGMCDPGHLCATLDEQVPIRLCYWECNPLKLDCPYDDLAFGCYPAEDAFACVPWRTFGDGQYGNSCVSHSDCGPGFWCAAPDQVPDCSDASGCCSTFCNTGEPNECPGKDGGQTCVFYYETTAAPTGHENVGVCIIER